MKCCGGWGFCKLGGVLRQLLKTGSRRKRADLLLPMAATWLLWKWRGAFSSRSRTDKGCFYISTKIPCWALQSAYFLLCKVPLCILSSVALCLSHLTFLASPDSVPICLSSINDVPTFVIFKALSCFKLTHTYILILCQVLKTFPKNFLSQGFKLPNRATMLSIRALYFSQRGEKVSLKHQLY